MTITAEPARLTLLGTIDGVDGLTRREQDVVGLIASGLPNTEIADRLYLSINSVKTYIRTAYRKMGVERRPQAVVWALQHGLGPSLSEAS